MRELIRPALFMVARAGLFLSTAIWITGQWCVVGGSVQRLFPTQRLKYIHLNSTHLAFWFDFNATSFSLMPARTYDWPGVFVLDTPATREIAVAHLPAVAFFAMCCGALMWGCGTRKRKVLIDERSRPLVTARRS